MTVQPIATWPGAAPGSTRRIPAGGHAVGVIVAFPQRQDNRFGLRERAELLAWAEDARALGICRVALERADPMDGPEEVGDFVLIYDDTSGWARWAVAPERRGYLLWSPNGGQTIGRFPTLGAALAAIHAPAC